jgi:hypothetical protein
VKVEVSVSPAVLAVEAVVIGALPEDEARVPEGQAFVRIGKQFDLRTDPEKVGDQNVDQFFSNFGQLIAILAN